MLHTDFDPAKTALINPWESMDRNENMPENLIGVFSKKIVDEYLLRLPAELVDVSESCMCDFPIYRCTWPDGTVFALTMMPVGAPLAASIMEETAALGVKRFLMLGSCGVLNHDITAGHLLVPHAAVRDEGTSYHYLPAAEEVALDAAAVDAVCAALREIAVPHARVKTWTTDAFYRETAGKVEKRRAQGCAVVEMECAALAAVAEFRGLTFAQLLWAADSLAGEEWDSRNLGRNGMDAHELYMQAAVAALKALSKH